MPAIGLILKAAFGAILSALGKLLLIWEAFRKGEEAQKAKDDSASLKDATEARKIDDSVRDLTDDELNKRLHNPGA